MIGYPSQGKHFYYSLERRVSVIKAASGSLRTVVYFYFSNYLP